MATPIPSNHAAFSFEELQQAVSGTVVRDAPAGSRGTSVVTDSRQVSHGSIFVALAGDKHDAHHFVTEVASRDPFAIVVSKETGPLPGAAGVIRVNDTLRALGDLATAHVTRLRKSSRLERVVGVTGSVGKTSTKEMLRAALASGRAQNAVRATPGNLNNLVGVPVTLLSLDATTEIAVVEMGMNVPGEIARLAEIASPDLGIVTAVAAAHTEGVVTLEAIAEEKSALLRALPASALGAIAPADDEVIEPWLASVRPRLIRSGKRETADVRLIDARVTWEGTRVAVRLGEVLVPDARTEEERTLRFLVSSFGEGAAKNATTTLAAAFLIGGIDEARRAAQALGRLKPTPGRLSLLRGTNGTILLDDTYNSSPRAVTNALETAAELTRATGGRLVAVLGDMLELGALSQDLHARVGETAARLGTSLFVACGPLMRGAAEEARELGCDFVVEVDDPMAAVAPVRAFLGRGDVVVVKGSRALRMERVVTALETRGSSPPLEGSPGGDEEAA